MFISSVLHCLLFVLYKYSLAIEIEKNLYCKLNDYIKDRLLSKASFIRRFQHCQTSFATRSPGLFKPNACMEPPRQGKYHLS